MLFRTNRARSKRSCVGVSVDGRPLTAADQSLGMGFAFLWIARRDRNALATAFSADCRHALSLTCHLNAERKSFRKIRIAIWDLDTGKELRYFEGSPMAEGSAEVARWLPDGMGTVLPWEWRRLLEWLRLLLSGDGRRDGSPVGRGVRALAGHLHRTR